MTFAMISRLTHGVTGDTPSERSEIVIKLHMCPRA